MAAATKNTPARYVTKLAQSRLWLVASTATPICLALGVAVWLANDVSRYRVEVQRLHAESAALQEEVERANKEKAEVSLALEANRRKVDELTSEIADLAVQREKLVTMLSFSESADAAIANVRSTMADQPARVRAESLYRRGQEVSRLGKTELARQLYEAAVREDKTYAFPLISLGFLAANRRDLKEAEQRYLDADKADPDSLYAALDLTNLYLIEGRLDKAAPYADRLRAAPVGRRPPEADEILKRFDHAHASPPK